ncbi:MAG: hypothetical protein C5B59_00570, partial [Bacteroidetes bacterium]
MVKQRKQYRRRRAPGEGSVQFKNGAFHLRALINGKAVSAKLCDKDDLHFSVTCPAVRELATAKLKELNDATGKTDAPSGDMSVVDFWEKVYVPWAKEVNPLVNEPNLRASTLAGYEQVWSQHLREHFGSITLATYETPTATAFLTEKAKTQGRNTVAHIRSLMSGIFSNAISRGYIKVSRNGGKTWEAAKNPIQEASVLGKTARPAKTGHYSLREALSILAALSEHVEGQLVMALSFFWGLRPSEIRGLKWEDFSYGASD